MISTCALQGPGGRDESPSSQQQQLGNTLQEAFHGRWSRGCWRWWGCRHCGNGSSKRARRKSNDEFTLSTMRCTREGFVLRLSLSRGFGVHRDRLSGPAMNYPGPLLTLPWRMDEIGHNRSVELHSIDSAGLKASPSRAWSPRCGESAFERRLHAVRGVAIRPGRAFTCPRAFCGPHSGPHKAYVRPPLSMSDRQVLVEYAFEGVRAWRSCDSGRRWPVMHHC